MKLCKVCKSKFTSMLSTARVCSPICAMRFARASRDKAEKTAQVKERREDKVNREKIKSRADWAKEAQASFNAWVRMRDAHLPCISCGRHHEGQYHAGHYLSRGARPELAYEPLNCQKQCAPCNVYLSGNIALYRINLIQRIGLDRVEWLEGPHEPKKYTIDDLKVIKETYSKLTKEMQE